MAVLLLETVINGRVAAGDSYKWLCCCWRLINGCVAAGDSYKWLCCC